MHRVADLTRRAALRRARDGADQGRGQGEKRVEALRLSEAFRARVVDTTHKSFVFELTGATDKIDAFIELDEAARASSRCRAPASSRSSAGPRGCERGAAQAVSARSRLCSRP